MKKRLLLFIGLWIGFSLVIHGQEVECGTPTGLTAINTTATSFGLRWNTVPNASQYIVGVQDTSAGILQTLFTTIDTSVYITGLMVGSQYQMLVSSICESGDTSLPVYILVTTSENDTCQYSIEMTDTYGDGWNNASLSLYTEDDILIKTFRFDYDYYYSGGYTKNENFSCDGRVVRLLWTRGYYDGECGFIIKDAAGNPIITGVGEWYPEGTDWRNASMINFKIYNVYGQLIHNALMDYYQGSSSGLPPVEIFSIPFPCLADSNAVNHVYYSSSEHGSISVVSGTMSLFNGQMVGDSAAVIISADPASGYTFEQMVIVMGNDTIETTSSQYYLIVTDNVYITASFRISAPELHIVFMSHSDLMAGQNFNVSWTVKNDGTESTPVGATWVDRVYLSDMPYINQNGDYQWELLGSWDNISSLAPGESYTQSVTVSIPLRHGSGQYYLFVLTDAYNAYNIQWEGGEVPESYNPPPYVLAKDWSYNNVIEESEMESWEGNNYYQEYWHDNFNMKSVQVTIPPLADLEVTNIIRPTNFYSGTQVSVTATITNTGEAPTLSNGWRDVLYISTSPEFSSAALQLASVWHNANEALAPNSSYQVTFSGTVPLSWYGEAYFFITTDQDDNEYEHVANDNNTSRSDMVNIILTPPADLVVSSIRVPAVASNQTPFTVSYTVNNVGLGLPDVNNWVDRIYLSSSATLPWLEFNGNGYYWNDSVGEITYNSMDDTSNWCYLMATINHTGGIDVGGNYTINRDCTLPSFATRTGSFYVIVVTDAGNQVFEYQSEDNNTLTSRASAISFFFPDLVVDTVIVPDTIDNVNSFTVEYIVSNQGLGKAEGGWYDAFLFSGTNIGTVYHNGTLMPGESYSGSHSFTQPNFSNSTSRDITVVVDAYNYVDEKDAENNNSLTANTYAIAYHPDLYLFDLQLPDTVVVNHTVDLGFTVHNGGQKSLNGYKEYTIYYSDDTILANANILSYWEDYADVSSGGNLAISHAMTFPSSIIDGNYYLFVKVETYGSVPEDNLQNNLLIGGPYYLCHRPLPDLQLCNVVLPDTVQAGQTAIIAFDVINMGETTEIGPANIYSSRCITQLTAAGAWCPVQDQAAPLPVGNITLAVGDTLHYSQTVFIPPTAAGNVGFSLKVDAANNIMELNENNNSTTLMRYVQSIAFDIDVASIQASATYTTGDTLTLSWTVQINDTSSFYQWNAHQDTDASGCIGYLSWSKGTSDTLWLDRLYLSQDEVVTSSDILLGIIPVIQMSNVSYMASVTVAMPHTHTGSLYLIATSDAEASMVENNRANNMLTKSITATLAPLPNLRIIDLEMDDTVTQRQGCLIRYTVLNDGEGDAKGTWTDRIYCGSTLLGSAEHSGPLAPGDSYTDSIEVIIPSNLLGYYFANMFIDAENTVYEQANENDNTFSRPVLVLQAPPCDLIVTNVEAAANAIVGGTLTVSWTVQNIGDNTVSGYVKDGIYLSHDTLFDNSDVLIGTLSYHNSFASFGSIQRTLDCTIQGVTSGDYHVLVRTNIMRAFNEVSFDNNTHASVSTTEVALPTLAIGQAEQLTMASGNQAYYRIVVGKEYAGQTLSLTLTTEVDNAFNGLYLSHESMPSAARSDYGSSVPYARTQQILVPVLQEGTYYLMASTTTTNRAPQQITLLAEIIDFEILHLNTASGTNTGSVTTKVTGAKFDTIMDFRLVDASGYTPAQKVKFENSTQSFVTFNLTDLPAGTYHVEAELPGGVVTMKENAFVVEQGLPAELAVNIVAPSSVRVGNNSTVNIEYGNNGSTDLNVSGFMVVSANGHPIGLTAAELAEHRDTLTFSTAEPGMDPDIIRPNYFATKTIYVSASSSGTISIYVYPIRRRYE